MLSSIYAQAFKQLSHCALPLLVSHVVEDLPLLKQVSQVLHSPSVGGTSTISFLASSSFSLADPYIQGSRPELSLSNAKFLPVVDLMSLPDRLAITETS